MLLAIDMGNTQTAMGLFDGDELVQSWRMPTDRSYTADEIHVRLMGFFKMYGLSLDTVDAIAFAGVVPQLSREWHAVANRIAADAIVIGPQTAAVTKLRAARPQAVGADRVANAVAAETFYGAPAIVVDFGTATNIDVIDEDGYYIGGAIAPGIRISMDALAARAAKLASVPLEAPEHAIGRDTEECIKVGAVVGAAAMAEGLVARMKRELGREDATVIATGGLAGIVADSTDAFDVVDGQLTIKGICEIYRRMQKLGVKQGHRRARPMSQPRKRSPSLFLKTEKFSILRNRALATHSPDRRNPPRHRPKRASLSSLSLSAGASRYSPRIRTASGGNSCSPASVLMVARPQMSRPANTPTASGKPLGDTAAT